MAPLKFANVHELVQSSEMNLKKFSTGTLRERLKSCDFIDRAQKCWDIGDYENSFITVMKYLNILTYLQFNDKEHFKNYINIDKNYTTAINMAETLRSKLSIMYEERQSKIAAPEVAVITVAQEIDQKEFQDTISGADIFTFIKSSEESNCLLFMDARSKSDYHESHIGNTKFIVDIINVPDDIIEFGKSARNIEKTLPGDSMQFWNKRSLYEKIVVFDWGSANGKASILKNILLNFDRIEYNNKMFLYEKGFSDWIDAYPWTLSKIHPRVSNTPDSPTIDVSAIDFNLDFDSDEDRPAFDRSRKPAITQSPNKTVAPPINRLTKATAIETYERRDLLQKKHDEMEKVVEMDKMRLKKEMALLNELRLQKEAQFDEERQAMLIEEEEKLLREIAHLKTNSLLKDAKIQELESQIKVFNMQAKTAEENNIEGRIVKQQEEANKVKKECDELELERITEEARSRPKPNQNQHQRPLIDRSIKPKIDRVPVIGKTPGLTGLRNLGNTCYMNSILQCISNNPLLAKYFTHLGYRDDLNKSHKTRGEIAEQVAVLVRTLWSGQTAVTAAADLKKTVGSIKSEYKTCEQQDSHEFLTFLMDWLHNDLKKESSSDDRKELQGEMEKAWESFIAKNNSYISELFYGLQKSTVSCVKCNETSATFEPFSNLSLTIPDGESLHLSTCLELYLKKEPISGWHCPKCDDKRPAVKKTEFCRVPKILVIHLKRFSFLDIHSKKKTTFVNVPLDDLTINCGNERHPYSLYGVSNHYGTMEGGHYTAYCKNPLLKMWFKFDDQEVTPIYDPKDVVTSAAYILFYKHTYY